MKTIQLNKSSVELPDSWEDLSYREKIFTFGILAELFSGTLTPEIARLKMLVEYTGYKPSWIQLISETIKKDREQREIINFNLLRLSEELNFAFTVEDNKIIPNHVFKKNPISYIQIGRNRYRCRRFENDVICRTNITAREFSDCFDIFASMQGEIADADKFDCINQICAILFPEYANDYTKNLVSGHHWKMRYLHPAVKFGIVFWFTGIVKYYTGHPVYSLLFKSEKQQDNPDKVRLGMNEITLELKKEGFGDPETMNLNEYFDAQIKFPKDKISKALADGVKPDKISEKTGIPLSTIQKLS
jgi:hypothetical protein